MKGWVLREQLGFAHAAGLNFDVGGVSK